MTIPVSARSDHTTWSVDHSAPLRPSHNFDFDRFAWADRALRKLFSDAPSRVVADVGAGTGPMRERVLAAGGEWLGFDLFPQSESIARWDLDDPAPAGVPPAGVVLLLEVIEHLRNPWRAMEHVSRLISSGGYLVLTTPNPRWSRSRMHALAFGTPACFTEADMELNHHVFTPWPHVVRKMLADVGLEVVTYDTLDGRTRLPGAPVDHRYGVRLALALANKFLERRDPAACGMSYGMIARKPD